MENNGVPRYCPLLAGTEANSGLCRGERCAWWCGYTNQVTGWSGGNCALHNIAAALAERGNS